MKKKKLIKIENKLPAHQIFLDEISHKFVKILPKPKLLYKKRHTRILDKLTYKLHPAILFESRILPAYQDVT